MIWNLTKKKIVARRPICALSFITRARGMIARDFREFDAMVFPNCKAIHTMFMTKRIDVIFVDAENRVCEIRKRLSPWLPIVKSRTAVTVVEMPSGAIDSSGTEIGDILDLNSEICNPDAILKKSIERQVSPEIVIPCKDSTK